MKRTKLFVPALWAACAILAGCAAGAPVKSPDGGVPDAAAPMGAGLGESSPDSPEPAALFGIDWLLLEIRTGAAPIGLDRPKLMADNMEDFFSLRFEEIDGETRLSGKAAPNRYSGPCAWGEGSTLSIGLLASTRMLAFKEPEPLKEREFFGYLSRISRWALTPESRLELFSAGEDGTAAALVFEKAP